MWRLPCGRKSRVPRASSSLWAVFRELCARLIPCVRVIGGMHRKRPKIHGTGCLIDGSHVLTAHHVVQGLEETYAGSVVFLHDGAYRAECVYEREPLDIAVLRVHARVTEARSLRTVLQVSSPSSAIQAVLESELRSVT